MKIFENKIILGLAKIKMTESDYKLVNKKSFLNFFTRNEYTINDIENCDWLILKDNKIYYKSHIRMYFEDDNKFFYFNSDEETSIFIKNLKDKI